VSDLLKQDNADEAIIRAVKPYREELLAKRNQLLQAIEEIKLRNERIRELETNGLQVQKELWSLEADFEDRKDDFRRAREEIIELKKRLNKLSGGMSNATLKELNAGLEDDLRGSEELREELKKLTERSREAESRLQAELSGLRDELLRVKGGAPAANPMDPEQDRLLLLEGEIGKVRDQADYLHGAVTEYQHLAARTVLLLAQALAQHEELRREREAVRADIAGLKEQFAGLEELSKLAGKLSGGLSRLDAAVVQFKKGGAGRKESKARETEAAAQLAEFKKQVTDLEKEARRHAEQAKKDGEERARLETALAAANKSGTDSAAVAAEAEELRGKLKEEEKARLHLQEALTRQAADLKARDEKIKAALEEQSALLKRVQESEKERGALDQAAGAARARLAELEKSLRQAETDLTQYKTLATRHEESAKTLGEERQKLSVQLSGLVQEKAKQAGAGDALQKLLLDAQSALATERKLALEALMAEKKKSEEALAAERKSSQAALAERDQAKNELPGLREDAARTTRLKDDLAKVEKERDELKRRALAESDKVRSLDAARADAEQRLTETLAKTAAAEKAAQANLAASRQQLDQAVKDRDRLTVELEQARRAQADLQGRTDTLAATQSQFNTERGQLEERIRQLGKEVETERAATAKARQEGDQSRQRVAVAEQEAQRAGAAAAEEKKKAADEVEARRKELEEARRQAEADRARLGDQVTNLEEDRAALKRRGEQLAAEKTGLEHKLSAASAELTGWRQKAEQAAAETSALERARADQQKDAEALRKETEALRAKSGNLNEVELQRRAELETQLTRQTQALDTALREQELLKSQLNTATREKEMTADHLERREKAYGDLVRENQNLSKRIDKLAADLGTHQQGAEKAQREAARLDGELKKAQERVRKLEEGGEEGGYSPSAFQGLRQKLLESETKIRTLQDRAKSLENKFEFDQGLGERLIRSEERNRQLAGKVADLETSVKEQELLTKKFQARADKVEPLEHQVRKLTEETGRSAEQVRALTGEIERERAAAVQAAGRVKSATEAETALTRAREEAARLAEEVRRREEAAARLQRENEELSRNARENNPALLRVAELEQELARAREAAERGARTLAQVSGGDAKLSDVVAELDFAKTRIGSMEVQTRDLSLENTRLKNTVRTLSENLKAQWKKRSPNFHA
jgi:chromosome segregation ATPase